MTRVSRTFAEAPTEAGAVATRVSLGSGGGELTESVERLEGEMWRSGRGQERTSNMRMTAPQRAGRPAFGKDTFLIVFPQRKRISKRIQCNRRIIVPSTDTD